ncbi:MAG: hypothetical protein JSU59_02835 [Nitrospirota bacterium]|nr:MAG: hypothetical protein JSU59_02835 [Nitrospirota bacterium]
MIARPTLVFLGFRQYTEFLRIMKQITTPLQPSTRRTIRTVFQALDYGALAPIYCEEGGDAFWQAHRGPCERIGVNLGRVLKEYLSLGGRSLYVGAGIAELPIIIMEMKELGRHISAHNLRQQEVEVIHRACPDLTQCLKTTDARSALGAFDHIWMVSVLNDPERFPEVSALSYGRANPATFDPKRFSGERTMVQTTTKRCLNKLTKPGLVTTSVEEIPWITQWCEDQAISYRIGEQDYPTAIVGDPICFIEIG